MGIFQDRIKLATLDTASQKTAPNSLRRSPGYGRGRNIPGREAKFVACRIGGGSLTKSCGAVLEVGADIHERDKDHRDLLCCASSGESVDVWKLLFKYSVKREKPPVPLHAASRDGHG